MALHTEIFNKKTKSVDFVLKRELTKGWSNKRIYYATRQFNWSWFGRRDSTLLRNPAFLAGLRAWVCLLGIPVLTTFRIKRGPLASYADRQTSWFGRRDSNPRSQDQNLLPCRLATPECHFSFYIIYFTLIRRS